jgi:hypothetical protein
MTSAEHASRILSRIQKVLWKDIDAKLPEDPEVKPKFQKHDGTTTAGTTPENQPHDPNQGYSGNWETSVGRGFGPKI